MRIEHIAIWTHQLEALKAFYETYFGAQAGAKYINPAKQFESYFLTFDSGARLELMTRPDIPASTNNVDKQHIGIIHFAMAVGTEKDVDTLTTRLKEDGHPVLDGPRRTGDGYYESVVLDPDKNRIEITA